MTELAKDTFVYDDADGSFELEIGEGFANITYETNGQLNNISFNHAPHDLQSFAEFLLASGRACQVEFGRQELEVQKLILRYPRRL